MPVDPSISLGITPPPPINPLAMVSQFAQTQNLINQNKQFQQTFQAKQALGPIFQAAIDPATGQFNIDKAIQGVSQSPAAAFLAPDIMNTFSQREFTQRQASAAKQAQALAAGQEIFKTIAGNVDNPAGIQDQVNAKLKLIAPDLRPDLVDSAQYMLHGLVGDNPDRPTLISRLGKLGAGLGATPDQIAQYTGQKPFDKDTGAGIQLGSIDPNTGLLAGPSQTIAKAAAPDTVFNKANEIVPVKTSTGQTQYPAHATLTPLVNPNGTPTAPLSAIGNGLGTPGGGLPTGNGLAPQSSAVPPIPPMQSIDPAVDLPGRMAQIRANNGLTTPLGGVPSPTPAGAANPLSPAAPIAQPKAPPDLGAAYGSTMEQKEFQTGQGKAADQYVQTLNDRVSAGSDMLMRLGEMRPLLEQTQAGGFATVRADLARVAQSAVGTIPGVNQGLVDKIAGGNLAAAQELQKFSVQYATEQLKQMMSGAVGKLTNLEFGVFQKNNPNLDTDPRAIEKIFNFATRVYQRDRSEQQALGLARNQPGFVPSAWPAQWQQQLQDSGIIKPEQVTGQALGTQAGPTKTWKRVNGQLVPQ